MIIHIVQPTETIRSIAEMYGITVEKLIRDNELSDPNRLVIGQTLAIVYPEQTHIVQEGDTLSSIAETYGISLLQLLRNNPFLAGREYIYPGEIIVIKYNTNGTITTFGYCYPFINKFTLRKTLPSLTYLTVVNYRATRDGEIQTYYDDTEIIQLAKEYNTIPLAMITTLSPQGEPDFEVAYQLLLNEEYQDVQLNNLIDILQTKGYMGVNFVFSFMSPSNQSLYINFITKAVTRISNEGYLVFVTINPNLSNVGDDILFERVDYSSISQQVNAIVFLQFIWGTNYGPPSPVSSINNLREFVDYAIAMIPQNKFNLGQPYLAYDWLLPYVPNRTAAYSLTTSSAIRLASNNSSTIQFDEISQTPFFYYGFPDEHIVWSIDVRSTKALIELTSEHGLNGIGLWNIMEYLPQSFLYINSQYDVVKSLP